MRVLCIIPARSGSKGIPQKNVARLAGKPLIAHTIQAAQETEEIDRVIVSTDDREIAELSRAAGAEVVLRPSELAADESASEPALLHVLDELRAGGEEDPDAVVFLQATSPLRRQDDIARALETFVADGADSLLSAATVHGFVWRRTSDALRALTYDPANRPRRQEIGQDLLENGSIYIFKPWVLRETGNRLGGKVAVYEMDPLDSFQVDEPRDLELMERLMALREPKSDLPDLSAIRLLVLDFDGVMTDNRVLVSEDGTEAVTCNRSDGMGIEMLRAAGMESVVLSKEKNPVVAARCRKLKMDCIQGKDDKLPILQEMAKSRGLESEAIAYVGNDTNDLECMQWAGLGVAVRDAHAEALRAADWVTKKPGGNGAVREVCDALIEMLRESRDGDENPGAAAEPDTSIAS